MEDILGIKLKLHQDRNEDLIFDLIQDKDPNFNKEAAAKRIARLEQ